MISRYELFDPWFPGLPDSFSDRSGFGRLFPTWITWHGDRRDLIVINQLFGCVLGRHWWGNRFLSAAGEFVSEFFHEALCRPGACFTKSADCPACDVVSHGLQRIRVTNHTTTEQHPVGDFFHP